MSNTFTNIKCVDGVCSSGTAPSGVVVATNTRCLDGNCSDGSKLNLVTTGTGASSNTNTDIPVPKTDCVEGYETTGKCTSGKNLQTWVVSKQPSKDGKVCTSPTPPEKPIECSDCVSDWSPWSECVKGKRTRTTKEVSPAKNGGKPCSTQTQAESCGSGSISFTTVMIILCFIVALMALLAYFLINGTGSGPKPEVGQ